MLVRRSLVPTLLLVMAVSAGGPVGRAAAHPDAGGTPAWASRYQSFGGSPAAIAASPDGSRVFVAGDTWPGTDERPDAANPDYVTLALDASTGAGLWGRRYDGPGHGEDFPVALAVSADGSMVFVTGWSDGGGTHNLDWATVAYDSGTGVVRWTRRFDGAAQDSFDRPSAIVVSPDGTTVAVTGSGQEGGTSSDYITVAYGASTGHVLWVGRHDGLGHSSDGADALTFAPDGTRIYVTGSTVGPHALSVATTVAYDTATGSELWARSSAPDNGQASGIDVAVSSDGQRVVIVSDMSDFLGRDDYLTQAYGAGSGVPLWARTYDGPVNGDDFPVAVDVGGTTPLVFVTGYGLGSNAGDYVTLAYDLATGALTWIRRYDGPDHAGEVASAMSMSPDGSTVYVTGYSHGGSQAGSWDYATVAYDASNGRERWVARYDGSEPRDASSDQAIGIDPSPDGSKVFVTGIRLRQLEPGDFFTIAYET
jgi:hypothetical protein